MNIIRLFSTSLKKVSTSELAQLRKRTGFSLVNCRKALELNDNDIAKSEEWLKAEAKRLGWEKASKLSNRLTPEGLIAVAKMNNKVVMAEVNCETDFVARNEKFVSLCQVVAKSCLTHKVADLDKNKIKILLGEELLNLETLEKEKLNDYIVKRVGEFGEKIMFRRALFYEADNDIQLNSFVHPPITDGREICTGKYGVFVAYKKIPGNVKDNADSNLGVNLCKHIIALNPKKIGSPEDLPVSETLDAVESDSSKPENDLDSDEGDSPDRHYPEESSLIHQDFLMCPEKTVGEVLNENGVSVIDFHRFQCGEDFEVNSQSDENVGTHVEGSVKMRKAEGN